MNAEANLDGLAMRLALIALAALLIRLGEASLADWQSRQAQTPRMVRR